MATWRYTLLGLLGSVALAAFACAALTSPSPGWTCAVVSVTLTVLSYAVLAAIFRRAEHRAFWIGFVVVGWGYNCLVTNDQFDNSTYATSSAEAPIITTRLLRYLGARIKAWSPPSDTSSPSSTGVEVASAVPPYASTGSTIQTTTEPPVSSEGSLSNSDGTLVEGAKVNNSDMMPIACFGMPEDDFGSFEGRRFLLVGQSLWSLLLGVIGGLTARRIAPAPG